MCCPPGQGGVRHRVSRRCRRSTSRPSCSASGWRPPWATWCGARRSGGSARCRSWSPRSSASSTSTASAAASASCPASSPRRPLAVAGVVLGWSRTRARLFVAFALVPLPLVFFFQFPAGPRRSGAVATSSRRARSWPRSASPACPGSSSGCAASSSCCRWPSPCSGWCGCRCAATTWPGRGRRARRSARGGAHPAPGLHRPRVRRHLRPQELAVDRRRRGPAVRGPGRGRLGGRLVRPGRRGHRREPLDFDGWTRGDSELVHLDFSDFRVTTYTRPAWLVSAPLPTRRDECPPPGLRRDPGLQRAGEPRRAPAVGCISVLDATGSTYEIVFVDDGSKDRSVAMIEAFHEADARVRLIRLSRNFGHQAALNAGLDQRPRRCRRADGRRPPGSARAARRPSSSAGGRAPRWSTGCGSTARGASPKRSAYHVFYRLYRALADIDVPLDAGDFCLLDRAGRRRHPRRCRSASGSSEGCAAGSASSRTGVPFDRPERVRRRGQVHAERAREAGARRAAVVLGDRRCGSRRCLGFGVAIAGVVYVAFAVIARILSGSVPPAGRRSWRSCWCSAACS